MKRQVSALPSKAGRVENRHPREWRKSLPIGGVYGKGGRKRRNKDSKN